jgi:hypothetical protein
MGKGWIKKFTSVEDYISLTLLDSIHQKMSRPITDFKSHLGQVSHLMFQLPFDSNATHGHTVN